MNRIKSFVLNYVRAGAIFFGQKATIPAAASSFYAFLALIPSTLLIMRVIGLFLGNRDETREKIFSVMSQFFPEIAPEVFMRFKEIVHGPLFSGGEFTWINSIILCWSSLAFFDSIWNGLYLMTGDKSHLSLWKHLKGLAIIAITITLMGLLISLSPIIMMLAFLKDNFLVSYLTSEFLILNDIMIYMVSVDFGVGLLIKSNIFHGVFFLAYFTFLYRWFFSKKISIKVAFLGAFTFVFALLVGKNLFWIYFYYVRTNLISHYGNYYAFIVGLVWLFFVMCFFFYGASICHVFVDSKQIQENFEKDVDYRAKKVVLLMKRYVRRATGFIKKIVLKSDQTGEMP